MATTVRVHEAALRAMWMSPTGQVHRHYTRFGRVAEEGAKTAAPVRTGRLKRSISGGVSGSNQYGLNVRLVADIGYAHFVADGTAGKTGPTMVLYSPRGPYGSREPDAAAAGYSRSVGARVTHVEGQRANRFLQRGIEDAFVALGYRF